MSFCPMKKVLGEGEGESGEEEGEETSEEEEEDKELDSRTFSEEMEERKSADFMFAYTHVDADFQM